MFTHAIVRPPAANFASGLTTAGIGRPDYVVALQQHAAYCDALESCGLKLIKLPADPSYPDSTFVEDTAVLAMRQILTAEDREVFADHAEVFSDGAQGKSLNSAEKSVPGSESSAKNSASAEVTLAPLADNFACNRAILTRPGAPSRSGEVHSMRKVLAEAFAEVAEIKSAGTLDGGDVCQAGNHFFIGLSQRTNRFGAEQLAAVLTPAGYTASFVDINETGGDSLLHLKSGIAYLGNNRLALVEALADHSAFQDYGILHVPRGDDYAANCLWVNDRILVASGFPRFEKMLLSLGHQLIVLEMSEFQKMDGGLSCLSLRF